MFNSIIGKVAASFIKVFNKPTDKLLRARWKMTNYKQLIFFIPPCHGLFETYVYTFSFFKHLFYYFRFSHQYK